MSLKTLLQPYDGPLRNKIPSHLHLIWLGDAPIPKYAIQNYDTWRRLMPHWTISLWTNQDLLRFPKEVQAKIEIATKGAQKADILRYFVLEYFGGIYVDLDTTPLRSLDPLCYGPFQVWAYHDNQITWTYMCNSPIASVRHHPILQDACRKVLLCKLNTSDPHLHTGPKFWATCVHEYLLKSETQDVGLIPCEYFSKFLNSNEKFGIHEYAATWREHECQ
jgi:mannosyltransferase OCH1-like enzyme